MDLRTIKTRKAIKEAFIDLLSDTDINKITVTTISERAMINRKTFYLHYETIEDLISEFLNEIADEFIEESDKLPPDRPHEDANSLFLRYCASRPDYIQKIFCYPPYHELCDILFDKIYYHNLPKDHHYHSYSPEKQNIIHFFYRSATMDIYRQWIKDNRRMSIDEICELSGHLISHGVSDI